MGGGGGGWVEAWQSSQCALPLSSTVKKNLTPKIYIPHSAEMGKPHQNHPQFQQKTSKMAWEMVKKKSLTGITDGPSSKDGRACSANTVNDYAQKCNQLCFFVGFQGMGSILKGDRKGGKILRNS